VTEILNQYLSDPPTITQKIVFSDSAKKMTEVFHDRRRDTVEFLEKWQASWEGRE
jgi:hypothetical protein